MLHVAQPQGGSPRRSPWRSITEHDGRVEVFGVRFWVRVQVAQLVVSALAVSACRSATERGPSTASTIRPSRREGADGGRRLLFERRQLRFRASAWDSDRMVRLTAGIVGDAMLSSIREIPWRPHPVHRGRETMVHHS